MGRDDFIRSICKEKVVVLVWGCCSLISRLIVGMLQWGYSDSFKVSLAVTRAGSELTPTLDIWRVEVADQLPGQLLVCWNLPTSPGFGTYWGVRWPSWIYIKKLGMA